jgi:hypothetical protein
MRCRRWLRPQEFDPVRREAGRQLARLRQSGQLGMSAVESSDERIGSVVSDLQRLRYGKRETWPEPKAVFRNARRVQRIKSKSE